MRIFTVILDVIMAVNMAVAVVVSFTAVFFRYVIGSSLVWAFELSLALLTYMTFIGCYAALRHDKHLRVDVIVKMFPRIPQAIFFILAQLTVLLVAVVMIGWGFEQFMRFRSETTLVMAIPRGYLYIIIPLSGLAIGIETICRLVAGLGRVLRGEYPEDQDMAGSDYDV